MMIETDGVRIAGSGKAPIAPIRAMNPPCCMARWGNGGQAGRGEGRRAVGRGPRRAGRFTFPEAELLSAIMVRRWPHDPAGRGTHQAGDGAALARGWTARWSGFPVEDVRQGARARRFCAVLSLGLRGMGHGAGASARAPVAFLNLGGVGNLARVDPGPAPQAPGPCIALTPAQPNAPLNDLVHARPGWPDEGGRLAQGQPDEG